MIKKKSPDQIAVMHEGGKRMGAILKQLCDAAVEGKLLWELDALAQKLIAEANAVPAFLHYAPAGHTPYPLAVCLSVNDTVVHGIPARNAKLQAGDIVGLDLGMVYQGLYLDAARTVGVGKMSDETDHLLRVTREALARGVAAAQVGNTVGDIGHAVGSYIEAEGLGVVHQLVGHGVGFAVHEEPQVPNFGRAGSGIPLEPGLVIAIEPMVTIGDPEVQFMPDGWTVKTVSGNVAAHEENTVAITVDGPIVLTA